MTDTSRRGPAAEDPSLKRACDQCRTRKVRCDKESPCSNCRSSNRTCSSTGLGQRPKEQRQRVLISEQYEKKIDLIDDRLANIEELLRGFALRPSRDGNQSPGEGPRRREASTAIPPLLHSGAPSCAPEYPESEPSLDGVDSSVPANTIFASEFIEVATQRASSQEQNPNPDISAALTSLRQLVSLHKRQYTLADVHRFPRQKDISAGGLSQLPMPPLSAAIAEIENVNVKVPCMYGYIISFTGSEDFRDRVRKVYFRSEDYTCCTYIIVNTALYYLFQELAYASENKELQGTYREYYQLCQTNVETALGNLPMFLPAHCETIEALHLGALYAIEISRPSFAWQMIAKAADICRVLGYHRKQPPGPSSPCYFTPDGVDLRTLMFWHTYILDSCLSLRMGRPPAIQEWDIEITVDSLTPCGSQPWGPMIVSWVHHSAIQNKLYKYLYSPAALSQPREELEEWARRLSQELMELSVSASEARRAVMANLKSIQSAGFTEIHVLGDEVSFYSTLTLAYRAIPAPEGAPSRFCEECIDAARIAMRAHKHCIGQIADADYLKAVYVHWAIMLTPFAPFFVLLCHAIDTSDMSDLPLLEEFMTSLVPAIPWSESSQKLHRLCQVMCSIARFYVEARQQQEANESMRPIGDEFEMYLGELGFMNMDQMAPHVDASAAQGDPFGQQAAAEAPAQLADWFSSSRNMLGLMEEDLQDIVPVSWNG